MGQKATEYPFGSPSDTECKKKDGKGLQERNKIKDGRRGGIKAVNSSLWESGERRREEVCMSFV